MNEETQIKTAEFSPKVRTYWLLSGALVLTITVVGIPLLLLWFPLGRMLTQRYLDRMSCVLTDKALKVGKGIWVRTEKTIPLDKITDMGMVQGPIMRHLDLHTLTVETAGQSGEGALVSLTGIVDARLFREAATSGKAREPRGNFLIWVNAFRRFSVSFWSWGRAFRGPVSGASGRDHEQSITPCGKRPNPGNAPARR